MTREPPDDYEREALIAGQTDMRAEMRELRAEVERLQGHMRALADTSVARDTEIGELRADNERLREQVASLQATSGYEASIAQIEIERLRAALRLIDEFAWTAVVADSEEARIGLNERLAAVRAALEPKP